MARLLHRNPNFEEALAELQNANATSARSETAEQLRKLETAIVEVFDEMNKNLAAATFSFGNDKKFAMPEFLTLFDAIFTLNQDLLIEAQYANDQRVNLSLVEARRGWLGVDLPGIEVISNPAGGLFDPVAVQRRPAACAQHANRSAHATLFQTPRLHKLARSGR